MTEAVHPHPGTPHRRIAGGIPCPDLDLSGVGIDDPIGTPARRHLERTFDAVVGLSVNAVHAVTEGDRVRVSVEVAGWSPSLHAIAVQYVNVVPRDDARSPKMLTTAFRPAVMEQLGRSMAGSHLGLMAPLPLDSARGPSGVRTIGGAPEMRHLLVDASWPAVAATAGEDATALVVKAVKDLHRPGTMWGGGSFIQLNGRVVMECGLGRIVATEVDIDLADDRHSATYDGLGIQLHGPVFPETALAAASGRPLGDLIRLHPALDDRIVRSAECDPDSGRETVIQLEPLLIAFDGVADAVAEHAA